MRDAKPIYGGTCFEPTVDEPCGARERGCCMKKWLIMILAVLCLLSVGACRKKSVKILHCDRCGREVEFDADSNMTEDWIIVCKECRKDMD